MNAIRLHVQKTLPPEQFQRTFYVLRACPDGEGDWLTAIDPSIGLTLRYKSPFDDAFLDEICKALENLRYQKRLVLVDCGGKIDKKNQRILNLCTHAIIVSRISEEIPIWCGAALASELDILARVESVRSEMCTIISARPLYLKLGKLERGQEQSLPLPQELLQQVISLLTQPSEEG